MIIKQKKQLTLAKKQAILGYLFISPFLIGFVTFFAAPFIQSIIYSMSDFNIYPDRYELVHVGFKNFHRAFFIEPNFRRLLFEAIQRMILDVPIIIIFSFFAANLLNQKFKGRTIARAFFFLPVILTSGLIVSLEQSDVLLNIARQGKDNQDSIGLLSSGQLRDYLMQIRINPTMINYITNAIDHIYSVVIASGVQILIFLAGLQSIPNSLFEASKVEGATSWENFWKITFPLISPLILVNVIYSIIDSFTNVSNLVISEIQKQFTSFNIGYSSALAWIYFAIVITILAILYTVISKRVFYYE